MSTPFESVLSALSESSRADVVAAWGAVETQSDPVSEVMVRALRDVTLRAKLEELLAVSGRTLVRTGPGLWTSGYQDHIAAVLVTEGGDCLTAVDRAVLVVVLVYSVALPRSQGALSRDDWVSAHPTTPVDLKEFNQIGKGAVQESLTRLHAAGLLRRVSTPKQLGVSGASYVPGAQFHRLTPAAKARLQDELILAAGPETALADAIRLRRNHAHNTEGNL
jgi:hypothetical protein